MILSLNGEGGYIYSLNKSRGPNIDKVRLTDRFFLGQPEFAGFDIRGVGPRVLRVPYDATGNLVTDRSQMSDDALGGRAYYMVKADLELPLGNGARELGLRPSIFAIAGSVFGLTRPATTNIPVTGQFREVLNANGSRQCYAPTGAVAPQNVPAGTPCTGTLTPFGQRIPGFQEVYVGNTWKPRISVGFGVNWNSPFGPFRIDIAKALVKYAGDDPKLFTFNVGTQF